MDVMAGEILGDCKKTSVQIIWVIIKHLGENTEK